MGEEGVEEDEGTWEDDQDNVGDEVISSVFFFSITLTPRVE